MLASGMVRTQRAARNCLLPLLVVAASLSLAGCGASAVPHHASTPSSYAISGTVLVDATTQPTVQGTPAESLHGRATESLPDGDVVPGEVLVVYREGVVVRAGATLLAAGRTLEALRSLGVPNTFLYRAPGASPTETIALARLLSARPDVAAATPNRVLRTWTTPTDPLYDFMWHLPAIGLPEAWSSGATGSGAVVAVVDTGVRGRVGDTAATHPDLRGALLRGYDFVSSAALAGDGDGRDGDPYDEGSFETNGTHGTHVAGTIAARAFDGVGIAGVAHQARILPVRVLGVDGSGSLADVLDGIAWAAGLRVSGVPANAAPARVINVSLGGAGRCSSVEQLVFDRVAAAGALVVVAAGNLGADARETTPASCAGVLTVGATGRDGTRASYSNYGPAVDLMAPGGDVRTTGPEGRPNGVLSAVEDARGFTWAFMQGTSMAAPHVAGVAALLLGLEPTLGVAQLRSLLTSTAKPLTKVACRGSTDLPLTGADCGSGLVDAAAAVAALTEGAPPFEDAPPDDGDNAPLPDLAGTRIVACSLDAPWCDLAAAPGTLLSRGGTSGSFRIDGLDEARYVVIGWSDRNGNGIIDAGDLFGVHGRDGEPEAVWAPAAGLSLSLEIVVERQELPFGLSAPHP
jgi:serine protease